jgi:glucosyl-dolichyl phosphate glucuronosyltransferase
VDSPIRPAVSVVIPTHSLDRWPSLVRTVASARSQTLTPAEIVVVVDHNPSLWARARRDLPGITVLENVYARGVSGNRNTGAFHTRTPIIAFLDDDTSAEPDWLERLVAPMADRQVVGTGGRINPEWMRGREPRWLPEEFLWAFGGSYAGLPTATAPVRNVWSASMAVRREVFLAVGGFRVGFGKLGDRARPEDTELCLRMSERGGHWMYVPEASIRHSVPAARATFGFFLRRCYSEGRGKVQMAGLHDDRETLGTERDYLRSLPRAVVRHLVAAGRGDGLDHALRAGGVVAGVAAAGLGGVVETVSTRRAERKPLAGVGAIR